jgi:hypothetical protein
MRRPPVLTPAWFALLAAIAVAGGVLAQAVDVYVFDDGDETFRWAGVVVFAVVLLSINVGTELWRRRQRQVRGLR